MVLFINESNKVKKIKFNYFDIGFKEILLFLIALTYYESFADVVNLLVYQGRDLLRAYELYHNKIIFYGPELTGGGFLPGPFYYYLLGLPYLFTENVFSSMHFLFVLSSISSVVIWRIVNHKYGDDVAFMIWVLFLLKTYILDFVLQFYNPSFLYFFFSCFFYLLIIKKINTYRKVFLASLLGALSLQIHYSAILILLFLITDVTHG